MTRMGGREIGAVSGRLPDNSGEFACMLRDRSFIRGGEGVGWCKWGGVIPFVHLKMGGCIKLCNHF